jgi:hypothetical protein
MFKTLAQIVASGAQPGLVNDFSVTVGKKPTSASSYVDDSQAVLELLVSLRKCALRDARNYSNSDFAGFHMRGSSSDDNLRGSSSPTAAGGGVYPDYGETETPGSPVVKVNSMIQRSVSLLNMQEYMSSISELNAEDDGAIFF